MFKIRYFVSHPDVLNATQRQRYNRWEEITEQTLFRLYGPREQRGNTLRMETDAEAEAREAYEDSLLEPEDRLLLRIGHFAEDYFRAFGIPADCTSVYEVDSLRYWHDVIGPDGRLFTCYVTDQCHQYEAKILHLTDETLEVLQSFCDWEPEYEEEE